MKKIAKKEYVAVYGTLMNGERNARWRRDMKTECEATIRGTLYDTGFGFPAFVPDVDGGKVRCEILAANRDQIAHMDVLEGYPNLYTRQMVVAEEDDGERMVVMVYVMVHLPEKAEVIECGDWRTYRRNMV